MSGSPLSSVHTDLIASPDRLGRRSNRSQIGTSSKAPQVDEDEPVAKKKRTTLDDNVRSNGAGVSSNITDSQPTTVR